VFLAAAVYTHITGRLLPIILLGSALWVAWRERRPRVLVPLAIALLVAAVLVLPQMRYFRAHPEMISYRADQVSLLNSEVNEGDLAGALAENGWHLLLTPAWRGDGSWYHNLRHRPVFDVLAAVFFLIGVAFLLRDVAGRRGRTTQAAAVLLLVTLGVTPLPSLLSVGAPNYVRLTGTWPVLFLLPAWGLERAAAWLDRRPRTLRQRSLRLGPVLIALVLGVSLYSTLFDYFRVYASAPQIYPAFNAAAVERGRTLAGVVGRGPTYVSPVLWQQSVIRFLNIARPPRSFDANAGLVLPPSGDAWYAFDPADSQAAASFRRRWPWMASSELHDSQGALSLTAFHLAEADRPSVLLPSTNQLPVRFGDRIALEAARVEPVVVHPGDAVTVTLQSLALAPTDLDHNLFLHVLAADGRSIGQLDGPPLGGSYGTDQWQPGERILQSIAVPLAPDAPAGPATVALGWYDWRTGRRLPIRSDDDAAVDVGRITVTPP
jgi:hypothetical protein